ncbi:phosphatidylinositol 4-kinase gamma 5-like [Gossypium australe]|uniref:1-phosphatidylinositol 4-kinase n=1 Tax=Gossypium australe TaxID=47621 RepID=A0A5B6UMU8_9ROSI|nr:phosphatidylinositol 4-kinase gamma 5-like [Gossypium australe]
MASKLESPVQTQMAVSAFNSISNGQYHGNGILKPVRTRRVFVQTETGCVLGLELDRNDNAHTVKRRMQIALNVPTDESSLTFGDLTLNNDLSAIRNDSPLLLTRNTMHRSSSTPCLSPAWKNLQPRDGSGLVEILGCSTHSSGTTELVKDIMDAIKNGVDPIPISSGLGGAYFFRNIKGENVAIVKPTDEEPFAPNNPKGFVGKALGQPGLKRSVRVGETGFREVAAYLLDYDHFANVPPTVLVKVTHSIFNVNDGVNRNKLQDKKVVSKIASLQQFIPHDFDAGDYGTSSFPVDAIHRIGILDIRIFNTDRHAGNLLVRKLGGVGGFSQFELIPIDHGLCLPESLEDPYFEWIHWPQASIPFSEDELEYIKNINPIRDSDMLRAELPMIREACLRVLVLCSIFLKEAAAFGLCLAEIGEMMSREFHALEEEPSELELVCIEAKELVMEINMPFFEADERDDEFQFDIDCKEAEVNFTPNTTRDLPAKAFIRHWSETVNNRNFLAEVDEDIEASEIQVDKGPVRARNAGSHEEDWFHTASRLSLSLKRINNSGPKGFHYHGQKPERTHTMDYSSRMRRSANEQLLTLTSFVKFADMNEEEWNLFIVKFKKLLCPAFANRRSRTIGERQRLGTSCQF